MVENKRNNLLYHCIYLYFIVVQTKATLYCCTMKQVSSIHGAKVSSYKIQKSTFSIQNCSYLAPSPNKTVFTVRMITIKSMKIDMFLM